MRAFSRTFLVLVCAGGIVLRADEPPPPRKAPPAPKEGTFKMGEVTVVVTDTQEALDTVNTKVDADEIQLFNRDTVGTALNLLPGVSFSVNSRNEQMLYLRGNDSRQVPVFVDGVPVYVPYDGEMDYGRFTTFDLAEIQVAKGFSSVTYGPNTLGGAINLVTRKPVRTFEGDAVAGAGEGNTRRAALNVGTNQGLYYIQASGSYLSSDHWRMSSDFVPTSRENGGWRDNSYTMDKKASLKFGLTPNATDEYVVGYINQKGDKGNPVATDPTVPPTYWQWPTWNKESAYLTTRTAIGSRCDVKFRAYYDTYDNTINEFTDGTFTAINKNGKLKPTGMSFYKDFTHGELAEFETMLIPSNSLRAVVQTKTDVHRENNGTLADTSGWLHYEDRYLSAGLEDSANLGKAWDLSLGLGWDRLEPHGSGTWPLPGAQSFFHGQAGLFWKPEKDTQVYATVAQKDHFPTLKDRYSLRLGLYIDNPDLKPERSLNYELGVKWSDGKWLQLESCVFLSDIRDLIQGMPVAGGMMQNQNIGEVKHSGFELSAGIKPSEILQAGLGYTYLDRRNVTNPAIVLTGTPKNNVSAFVKVSPIPQLFALVSFQAQDDLWDSYSNVAKQTVTHQLAGFGTTNASLGWKPHPKFELDAGLTNLFDHNYQLITGYPLPGRSWFANARLHF